MMVVNVGGVPSYIMLGDLGQEPKLLHPCVSLSMSCCVFVSEHHMYELGLAQYRV